VALGHDAGDEVHHDVLKRARLDILSSPLGLGFPTDTTRQWGSNEGDEFEQNEHRSAYGK
jgi:hypothetical protein